MAESFRRHKSEMRTNHYDKFDNDEDRVKNRPQTISEEDWKGFLINEAKPGASERRDKGKKNRAQYNYGHHTGRKSHAIIEHEMVCISFSILPKTNIFVKFHFLKCKKHIHIYQNINLLSNNKKVTHFIFVN